MTARKITPPSIIVSLFLLVGCVAQVHSGQSGHDIDRVFGGVDVTLHKNGTQSKHERHPPKLFVDTTSAINGDIHLYREVRLEISEGARGGEVIAYYQ